MHIIQFILILCNYWNKYWTLNSKAGRIWRTTTRKFSIHLICNSFELRKFVSSCLEKFCIVQHITLLNIKINLKLTKYLWIFFTDFPVEYVTMYTCYKGHMLMCLFNMCLFNKIYNFTYTFQSLSEFLTYWLIFLWRSRF